MSGKDLPIHGTKGREQRVFDLGTPTHRVDPVGQQLYSIIIDDTATERRHAVYVAPIGAVYEDGRTCIARRDYSCIGQAQGS